MRIRKIPADFMVMSHRRAVDCHPELAIASEHVIEAKGLTVNDLKARILDKAYLSRHRQPLLLFPTQIALERPSSDDCSSGRRKLVVGITRPQSRLMKLLVQCADRIAHTI